MNYSGIELADPTTVDLKKKTKEQLIDFIDKQYQFYNKVGNGIIVQSASIKELTKELNKKDAHLDMAERNILQAQRMIQSVTEGWDDYEN